MDNYNLQLLTLLNTSEDDLINNDSYKFYLKYLIRERQFSEKFLIHTYTLYESSECLTYQYNLTPYFCFKYLLNNPNDSAEESVSIYDILRYIANRYPNISLKYVMEQYENVLRELY